MELMGVRLVGFTEETLHKLVLTMLVVAGLWAARRAFTGLVRLVQQDQANPRTVFWARQGASVVFAVVTILGLVSIWFDDPARFATALGLVTAGLAFALQKVVTSVAGYAVIMRGNTFTVGERITMGGVRGDVIDLGFIQTRILEMGEPPSVQSADPAVWVRSRQYTGRIVTVTNDKVFDTPIYNYSRDFPFIWEELRIPVPFKADHARAEEILLDAARRSTEDIRALSDPVRRLLEQKYLITVDDLSPRVFYRLTDNWLEMTVRFIVREHGIRDIKDAMSRAILQEFRASGIEVASATYELVGLPPVRVDLPSLSPVAPPAADSA